MNQSSHRRDTTSDVTTLASRRINAPNTTSNTRKPFMIYSKPMSITTISAIANHCLAAPLLKVPPLCASSAGQAAGVSGPTMGGGPRHPAVAPRLGPQGPGAPGGLAPGAALGGVGEEQHHHPHGGAGHHRPADGGLRGRKGLLRSFWKGSNLISPWSPLLVWARSSCTTRVQKTEEGERTASWSQNQCLQPLSQSEKEGRNDGGRREGEGGGCTSGYLM